MSGHVCTRSPGSATDHGKGIYVCMMSFYLQLEYVGLGYPGKVFLVAC